MRQREGYPLPFYNPLSQTTTQIHYNFMAEFIQIEKSVLEDILGRVNYLHKVSRSLYERVRNKEPDDWLTMEQLCGLLHISESKVRSLKKSGRIGFVKCGKGFLYSASDAFGLLERIDADTGNGRNLFRRTP